jgi:hypothetical protein
MADSDATFTRARPVNSAGLPSRTAPPVVRPEDYREAFGEELAQTLNVDTWRAGRDLGEEYRRIEAEVRQAVGRESDFQRRVREEVHPQLAWSAGAPKGAGRYAVTLDELADAHALLFRGGVEACDGNIQIHDTLPLTIYQIGVSLVSYGGNQGTWFQQVARIAKRGRKRWLGLVFVTQLPQHLPRQLLALVNNYILHKITDAQVIGVLRKTVSDMDEGQWTRLTGLAPGQAIVSFGHMARPLLTSIDPAGAKLRLVD